MGYRRVGAAHDPVPPYFHSLTFLFFFYEPYPVASIPLPIFLDLLSFLTPCNFSIRRPYFTTLSLPFGAALLSSALFLAI